MSYFDIFRFGTLPMVMAPDEGGDGGSGGGGSGDGGDAGAGAGDDKGAAGGDAGDKGAAGADDKGAGAGDGDDKGAAAGGKAGGNDDKSGDKGGKAGADAGDKGKAADKGAAADQPKPFPDDWREQMAKDKDGKVDDKQLAILKRFTSPKAYNDAYFGLKHKVDSGEFKKPLTKDATPEEVAAFRKENGIPEKSEEYLKGLPEGVVFGEDDKAVLDPFLNDMLEKNVPPAAVHSALNAYHAAQAHQTELIQARDLEIAQATEDSLRESWGADYRGNMGAVNGLLDGYFPAEIKQDLMNARLGDAMGTPLLHHPAVLEAFAKMGRVLNPGSTLTHGKSTDSMDTINDQIDKYEKQMGDKKSDYWKSEKSQSHLRELYTLRDRMQSKG